MTMNTDSFRDFVLEQLDALDGLRCKPMFGGHGLYLHDQFFGIVHEGRLYFKTHPDTLQDYLNLDCAVFAPSAKQRLKNYREVQAEILEDSASLCRWAERAAR